MAAGLANAPADRVLVINRVFDAPRTAVFKAWTDPDHISNWFGPRGSNITSCSVDLRVGGIYRLSMRSPDGNYNYLKGIYREIVEPEKLVSSFTWTDPEGNPTRPETILTLTFGDAGNKTNFTLHQAVFESPTACEMHREGWTGSFERLAAFVAKS